MQFLERKLGVPQEWKGEARDASRAPDKAYYIPRAAGSPEA